MQAVKGLWQFWFWTADAAVKERIEDTLLAALAKPQPAWVESNLRDAIYNLADENIRYLYNNWVPLLARPEDRERAIQGRLAVEDRLADKFATVLEGRRTRRRRCCCARSPSSRCAAAISTIWKPISASRRRRSTTASATTSSRSRSSAQSADRIAKSLLPLLDAPDPEMRRLAAEAALLVRETRFADVNRMAGPRAIMVRLVEAKLRKMPEASRLRADETRARDRDTAECGCGVGRCRETRRGVLPRLRGADPQKRGKDGYACVHCHATHTLFDGTWATVKNVVDTANPENSLILRKPTSSSETEGVAGSKTLPHGGGVRFTKDSPEYATILEWIKGAHTP